MSSRIRQGLRYDLEELQFAWPTKCHWQHIPVSTEAQKILAQNVGSKLSRSKMGLTYEHSVPLRVLFDKMVATSNPEEMVQVLRKYFQCTVITKAEDKRLNGLGLRSKMPTGQEDVWNARYNAASIEFVNF